MLGIDRSVTQEAEAWSVPKSNLTLLAEIADRVAPEDPVLARWFDQYFRQHQVRLAGDLEIVSQHLEPRARILEYGAIPLLLTGALSARDYNVRAVDIQPERFAAAIGNLGLDVRRCDVETESVPFEEETFDAVLFNEIFEHLRINPVFTMGEVLRVLRSGGLLLLSTPNLRSFRGIRNLVVRNQGHAVSAGVWEQYEKLETLGHMGHVREYTTREVTEFLVRLGLRVEKVIYRGGHGRGIVGVAERLAPSLRPFFTLVARKVDSPAPDAPDAVGSVEV